MLEEKKGHRVLKASPFSSVGVYGLEMGEAADKSQM